MSILIKNGTILTLDQQDRILNQGDVLIQGDRIAQISEHIENNQAEQVIDASDKLVMPGLNIAHAHSFAQLFKGVFDGRPLDVWILDTNAPPLGWSATPRMLYLRTILGAIELVRSGATIVWDDLSLDWDLQDPFFEAYRDIGMRAIVTATMYDRRLPDRTLYLRDVLPDSLLKPLMQEKLFTAQEWMNLSQAILEKWHGLEGRLYFGASVAWPQGASDDLLIKAKEFADKHNLSYVTHVLETKVQQVTGQVFYGKSIVQRLHDLGVLSPRTAIVHGIWITDDDIRLLAKSQASVLHNPGSNLILGSGLMPYHKLRQAGVNIALGVDEGIQSKWNPFEMMKTAALMHKISSPDFTQWPTSREILSLATRGGARSETLDSEIGSLAPGMKADIILVDLRTRYFTPLHNIYNQLVYCEPGSSVTHSIINGKLVMEDGKILTVDANGLLAELRSIMSDYWQTQEERHTLEFPRKVRPYVEQIYLDAVQMPTGINRWIEDERQWVKQG
jgi:cytosine/adenosine deaminase-related metal-dependent hydrolase